MRYFIKLQYDGTNYFGWQRQPNAVTIQEEIEKALSLLTGRTIAVTGCGRTDTGVHASQYYAHFDSPDLDHSQLRYKLNKILGKDIRIQDVFTVSEDSHARFSAFRRSYHYFVGGEKRIFNDGYYWYYPLFHKLDWEAIHDFTRLIEKYEEFKPFCKSDAEMDNYKCVDLKNSWRVDYKTNTAVYTITSNRFLRGMVRLIVGASMFIGTGKIELVDVKDSMDRQVPLKKALSAPPEGLFLTSVKYPFIESSPEERPTNWP